jgi:hypothetical protein
MKRKLQTDADQELIEEIVDDLALQDSMPADSGAVRAEKTLEADEVEGSVSGWEDPMGSQGHQMARAALEDEVTGPETMVERGLEEAEEELDEMAEEEADDEEA